MKEANFKDFTKAEKLSIIQLLIIVLKGEQQDKKQHMIWEYLESFELTLDDFEQHMATVNKDTFETTLRSLGKEKTNTLINLIHTIVTSEPIAKTMEYFILMQIFNKVTLTPTKYFIETLEEQGKTQLYPDFIVLKNT
ncbi:hypothetical protein ACX0HA_12390 [Flavobacterium hauense]